MDPRPRFREGRPFAGVTTLRQGLVIPAKCGGGDSLSLAEVEIVPLASERLSLRPEWQWQLSFRRNVWSSWAWGEGV
jgi:hypothetical protein